MLESEVDGQFTLTPPLPDPATHQQRLSPDSERIELIPYANTLLRMTVFPTTGRREVAETKS
jgi:hypothetical protein